MELRSLRVFVEVVREGGFTAAGQTVFLTQPSVSRHIKQLEEELGQVLLTRDHRKIVLTDAGKIVYQHALILLGESARLRSELADITGLRRGELNLGMPRLGGTLFVPLIKRFKEHYPAIELRLLEAGSDAIESALVAGDLELGMLLLPVDDGRFDSVLLNHDRLVLVAPHGSQWAKRKAVTLGELKDEPFILFPEGFALTERILVACRTAGFVPQITGRSGQSAFIAALVNSGVGIALLPRSVIHGTDTVAAVELEEPVMPWNLALAWPRGAYLSHAGKALIALAKSNLPLGAVGSRL